MAWAKDPESNPDFVRNVILALEGAQAAGEADASAAKRAVEALARAMGIIPSSEKARQAPEKEIIPVDGELAALILEEKKIKALERYVGRKLSATRRRIALAMAQESARQNDQEAPHSPSRERVLAGGTPAGHETSECDTRALSQQESNMGEGAIKTPTRQERQDLVLGAKRVGINGTKTYNPKTGQTLAPDLSQVGPKGRQITWRALANITVLVFGMALPGARIEKLFGKNGFSRAGIADHFAFIADRLLAVYVAMAQEIAQCDIIMGDDCASRVSEVTRYNRDLKEWKRARKTAHDTTAFEVDNPRPQTPWSRLSESSLTRQLDDELGLNFQSLKTNKERTPKIRLNTSVLSGELKTGDDNSRVVLYRTHLGSVGNLLSKILLSRKARSNSLIFVGDLSSSNHATDPEVLDRIKITYAGCASHARRPFKRHIDADPENCIDALDYFRALFHLEELIAEGRPKAKIRTETSMTFWQDLKELCESMRSKWSPSTALGEGIEYLLGNYDALTLYCKDERLPLSNDLSERLLRYEKLMDRSSFGRETVEGRARYDIIRSFWQSCVAAGVDPTFALLDVLLTSPELVSKTPSLYTPQAIARRLKEDPKRCAHLDNILHTSDLGSLVTYKLLDPNVPQDDDPA